MIGRIIIRLCVILKELKFPTLQGYSLSKTFTKSLVKFTYTSIAGSLKLDHFLSK